MATSLVIGQPGAGKTSLVIERMALPHFASDPKKFDPDSVELGNGIVVTNIPLNRDRWLQEFGEEAMSRLVTFPEFIVDPENGEQRRPFTKWEDFEPLLEMRDEHGRAPLFIIDEAHECIPKGMRFVIDKVSGQRTDTFPNRLLLLFTRQRHYLASFALVTQDPFSMAPDILKQVHSTLYVENAEMKGRKHAYTVKIWNKAPPRNFASVPFDKCDDGQMKPRSYNAETQSFFVSNSKNNLGSAGRALEGRYRHSRPIWKRPVVMFIPVGLGLVLYFGSNLLSFGEDQEAEILRVQGKSPAKSEAKAGVIPVPSSSHADEFAKADVIEDLGAVEDRLAVTDARSAEALYPTSLHSSNWRLEGRTGPVVATRYPGAKYPTYAHMADYAAFWGYSIEKLDCGWSLTRKDNVRHLYDTECLGDLHVAPSSSEPSVDAKPRVTTATFESTGSTYSFMGRPISGSTTVSQLVAGATP